MITEYIRKGCKFCVDKVIQIRNLNQDREDARVELDLIRIELVGCQKTLGEYVLHTFGEVRQQCDEEANQVEMYFVRRTEAQADHDRCQ